MGSYSELIYVFLALPIFVVYFIIDDMKNYYRAWGIGLLAATMASIAAIVLIHGLMCILTAILFLSTTFCAIKDYRMTRAKDKENDAQMFLPS